MVKTIALLMPALNEEHSVRQTLDSIFQSTRLPDEILIADGGSTDKTVEIARQYQHKDVVLKVVNNPEVYAGAGRNYAFEASTSDVVMLMDFGNTVAPDWIEKMAEPFEQEPNMDFATGAYLPKSDSDFEHVVACILYHNNALMEKIPLAELMKNLPKNQAPGALSLAVSRGMWKKVNGMPGWLRAAEDKLYGRKMMTFKPTYRLIPDAKISHHMRSNSWQIFKQMKTYSRGNGRIRLTHKHVIKLFILHLTLALGLSAALWFPYLLLPIFIGAAVYIWKSGINKIKKVDGHIQKKRYIFYAASIVIARDLGIVTGSCLGWVDWIFKPEYRVKYWSYVSGTDLASSPFKLE